MIKKYSSLDSISPMDSGWISPEGKFYSLKNSATNSHDAYAARLVKELRLSNKEERDPLHFLLNKGWLRVHGTNTIPPTINVMFSTNLDSVKHLVKKVYPDFFGEIYAELEGGEELYFHGSVDDFFKWTGNRTVAVKKYSELTVDYKEPKMKDSGSFEEFHAKLLEVRRNKMKLMVKKLLPKGGKVPTEDPGTFYIVSKEPTDKTKWRVTRFITHNGEVMPSGHVVCDKMYDYKPKDRGFTESVFQNISPDWEKWAAE